jgi:competence ComEA-like helix-hairpin-helix protein
MPLDPPPQPVPNRWLLRRADQATIATLCLFALVALAFYGWAHGGLSGRLIDIDHADHHTVEFKVDVNSAGETELANIPEVGQGLAERIVEYRQQHGQFQTLEELRHVRGIGPKTFERMKAYLLPIAPVAAAGKQ